MQRVLVLWLCSFRLLLSSGDSALLHRRRRLTWNYAPAATICSLPSLSGNPGSSCNGQDALRRIHRRYLHHAEASTRMAGDSRSVIRAEVGMNSRRFSESAAAAVTICILTACVTTNQEGALYLRWPKSFVAPRRYTYHGLPMPPAVQAGSRARLCVYHAHVEAGIEINAGLLGPIIVTPKGKGIRRISQRCRPGICHFLHDLRRNGRQTCRLFYAINGFIFGNLPA